MNDTFKTLIIELLTKDKNFIVFWTVMAGKAFRTKHKSISWKVVIGCEKIGKVSESIT